MSCDTSDIVLRDIQIARYCFYRYVIMCLTSEWPIISSYRISSLILKMLLVDRDQSKKANIMDIGQLNIFPLILLSDIVSINLVTLILENSGQFDVTLWRFISIKKLYCLGYLVFLENSTFNFFFFQIDWLLAYIL